ncbi:hypothetical protein [Candidatus Gromoviella agglomerans]|uniref:hypothetical protein n=1 Tax=Candidatus Gromoviella agglomerans TaxID=2806609 RepID=UPI001E5D48E0|nr:hypothetical protein [Candidatus Gromoviella agglomerans]UFX98281.1 hypothetical protein Gromo_00166 [Candidatus Gromoviella agglomerans]
MKSFKNRLAALLSAVTFCSHMNNVTHAGQIDSSVSGFLASIGVAGITSQSGEAAAVNLEIGYRGEYVSGRLYTSLGAHFPASLARQYGIGDQKAFEEKMGSIFNTEDDEGKTIMNPMDKKTAFLLKVGVKVLAELNAASAGLFGEVWLIFREASKYDGFAFGPCVAVKMGDMFEFCLSAGIKFNGDLKHKTPDSDEEEVFKRAHSYIAQVGVNVNLISPDSDE